MSHLNLYVLYLAGFDDSCNIPDEVWSDQLDVRQSGHVAVLCGDGIVHHPVQCHPHLQLLLLESSSTNTSRAVFHDDVWGWSLCPRNITLTSGSWYTDEIRLLKCRQNCFV